MAIKKNYVLDTSVYLTEATSIFKFGKIGIFSIQLIGILWVAYFYPQTYPQKQLINYLPVEYAWVLDILLNKLR